MKYLVSLNDSKPNQTMCKGTHKTNLMKHERIIDYRLRLTDDSSEIILEVLP